MTRVLSPDFGAGVDADRDPAVVLAADDNFAMPLAATVRSALDNLSPERKLHLFVLDGGLSDATKLRLERSWPQDRYRLAWIRVDSSVLANAPTSGHVNLVSYFRILMPRLLPAELRRVIYLDADLIVRRDLTQLWELDLRDRLCLAAQDCAAPYLDAAKSLENFDRCGRHLGSPVPITNFRELGLSPLAAYFNAGVMLVDLAAWRDADLSGQILACLQQNERHVLWWDQYALNVVLAGRWGALDVRWNQGCNIYAYPTWRDSPFDCQTFERLRSDPFIVHFTTRYKPWKLSCLHPLRQLYFEYLDRTEWAGWRPARFNRPSAIFELLKTQERRIRLARRRLRSRIGEWLRPRHHSVVR